MEEVDRKFHSGLATATEFDLAVIGGGPAGTSAATTAARLGARVLLLERGKLPRQRVCGEFVSAESIDLLTNLLDRAAPGLLEGALRIPEARLFFDGHLVSMPVEPCAASVARLDLDVALWRAAESEGVIGKLQTTVEAISGNGPFRISTTAGTFEVRSVINSSGRWSNLRKHADSSPSAGAAKWLGVKAHFAETNPHPSVDLYFFEGGYCGVQPVDLAGNDHTGARVNACAMVRSDVARSLPEICELNVELRERCRGWQPLTEPVNTSPLVFREPEPVHRGILLAGDAAGFVDPFVGDGISLALRSGALAAECLLPVFRQHSSLAGAEAHYREAYREKLLPVFRNSSKLRRLLSLPRPIRRSLGHVLSTPSVSRLLVRLTR
jgi:flavin-dependent dehydrogenase